MCDCYGHRCLFCKNELSIHIADFCTPRESVAVICPDCLAKKANAEIRKEHLVNIKDYKQLYIERLECREQLFGKLANGKYKGKIVLLMCKNPKAYGICLN